MPLCELKHNLAAQAALPEQPVGDCSSSLPQPAAPTAHTVPCRLDSHSQSTMQNLEGNLTAAHSRIRELESELSQMRDRCQAADRELEDKLLSERTPEAAVNQGGSQGYESS